MAIKGGIFGQVGKAVEQTKIEQGREEITIILSSMQMDRKGNLTLQDIVDNIKDFDETKVITSVGEIENDLVEVEHKNGYIYGVDGSLEIGEVGSLKVPTLTLENTTFTQTPNTWTNETIIVKIETLQTGYTLQYSTNNKDWSNYNSEIQFTENGTIYARLFDGTSFGKTVSQKITNIDKQEPNAPTVTTTSTVNSIRIVAQATDKEETATSGMSGIANYEYSMEGADWQRSATFSGLQANSEYQISVRAIDGAGNVGASAPCVVSTAMLPHANYLGANLNTTYWQGMGWGNGTLAMARAACAYCFSGTNSCGPGSVAGLRLYVTNEIGTFYTGTYNGTYYPRFTWGECPGQ